jgi:hypothetical protein
MVQEKTNPAFQIKTKAFRLLILLLILSPIFLFAQNEARLPALGSSIPHIVGMGYWGTVGAGMNFQSTTRLHIISWAPDASACVNIGLGNPERAIGVDMHINIYGVSNKLGEKSNFGEGTINLHLSRQIHPQFWVAVGGYDVLGWETSIVNALKSYYLAANYRFDLRPQPSSFFSTLYITAGLGNGRFRRDADFDINRSNPFGVFGSLAIQVLKEGHFLVEWSGYGLYTGFSVLPFKKLPFQFIIGGDDLLHPQRRLVLAANMSLFLKKNAPNKRFVPPPPPPQMSRFN